MNLNPLSSEVDIVVVDSLEVDILILNSDSSVYNFFHFSDMSFIYDRFPEPHRALRPALPHLLLLLLSGVHYLDPRALTIWKPLRLLPRELNLSVSSRLSLMPIGVISPPKRSRTCFMSPSLRIELEFYAPRVRTWVPFLLRVTTPFIVLWWPKVSVSLYTLLWEIF